MNISAADTVDRVVSKSVSAAKVLSKHGIDFCSEGGKTLRDACTEANISLRKLLREISQTEELRKNTPEDVSALNIDELTDYIETYHHHFTAENIVFIKTSLNRLVRLYGERYPELVKIRDTFEDMTSVLTVHMQHEEFIVFPYIRKMAKHGKRVKSSVYRSVKSPIKGMLHDHNKGTAYLKKLGELTHHYEVPPGEGNAFKVTYAAMRELEKDLQTHIAIENEILFPKALEMEIRLSDLTWPSMLAD